jgi:TPR repeat protein
MDCVFCAPFKWLCGVLNAGCAEMNAAVRKRLLDWYYTQANDWEIWERDPEKDRMKEAFRLFPGNREAGFQLLLELAENGSVWSMLSVAKYYESGNGVLPDPERMEHWFKRAFEGGSQNAQLRYTRILGLRLELAKCEEVLSVGAANDWAPALYWLARYRLRRSRSRETLTQVRPLLERAAAKGSLAAQKHQAQLMLWGRYGLRDIPRGFRQGKDAVEKMTALLDEDTAPSESERSAPAIAPAVASAR